MSSTSLDISTQTTETISDGVASGALMQIGLASSHTASILGRPSASEIEEAALLLSLQKTPEQRTRIYGLISDVLKRVGALSSGLSYALKLRLHVGEVSTANPGKSRVEELFAKLEPGKTIPRSELTSSLGMGEYTLSGHLSTLRNKHFPQNVFVTVDSGILLLADSADFIGETQGFFNYEEQRAPTRVSIFMYLLLKMGKKNPTFQMQDIFAEMVKIGLPVGNRDNLIAHTKTLFSNKGYLLERVDRGVYTLKLKGE